jgi:hypothetical protein
MEPVRCVAARVSVTTANMPAMAVMVDALVFFLLSLWRQFVTTPTSALVARSKVEAVVVVVVVVEAVMMSMAVVAKVLVAVLMAALATAVLVVEAVAMSMAVVATVLVAVLMAAPQWRRWWQWQLRWWLL